MSQEPHSVSDVVDGLQDLSEKKGEVTLGDVLDEFGNRSFAPIMLILALAELTPLGGIPGFPTLLAICIAIVAGQLAFGREHIWVPQFLEQRGVSSSKLGGATDKLDKVAEWLDNLAKSRLQSFARGPALRVAGGVILVLCAIVVPLEFLPFASSAPMLAIAIISLAIMVRDGLAMIIAWVLAAIVSCVGLYWFFSSGSGG